MVADIEIAQRAKMRPILDVAADIGLGKDDLVLKSESIAKVRLAAVDQARKARQGKLVLLPRCLDMNDRQLRNIVTGLGGPKHGVPREDEFVITAASEVMAILCLAEGIPDLKERLERIVVAFDREQRPVKVGDLYVHGAAAILLKDALMPNLVQTLEGTPALVHGGPFANIAHGHNSVLADRLGLGLGDV